MLLPNVWPGLNNESTGPIAQSWKYESRMNGWNTPADYKSYVHPHWLSYEEPNPMLHHLLGVLYIFFMIASCLGNGIVIYIFSTTKELKTPSNILILNLAICDFIMMIKTPVFIVNSFNEGPVFGRLGCSIYGLLGAYVGPCSAVTNAAIAYDRYRCISDPMGKRWSKSQASLIVLGCWVYASPVSLLPFTELVNRFVPEGYLTSCTFDYMADNLETKIFVFLLWIWCWIMPLGVIIFSYGKITTQVMTHEARLKEQAKKMNVETLRSGANKDVRNEIRVAKVGISLTTLFLLSWTPYFMIAFIGCYGNRALLTPGLSMIPACTCKLAACVDPFVYAINHPKYRLELMKRLPWLCVHEKDECAKEESSNASVISEAESRT
ncbi:UV wavelength opsin [Daphnia magna]|uniref:UV wavelength opsin n=1 Tax=Daphnia magna TaxID=35525 RepID=A0A164VAP4_9CRUS|nr:UV wavelength opsin [Daphnia magna]